MLLVWTGGKPVISYESSKLKWHAGGRTGSGITRYGNGVFAWGPLAKKVRYTGYTYK